MSRETSTQQEKIEEQKNTTQDQIKKLEKQKLEQLSGKQELSEDGKQKLRKYPMNLIPQISVDERKTIAANYAVNTADNYKRAKRFFDGEEEKKSSKQDKTLSNGNKVNNEKSKRVLKAMKSKY